MSSGVSEGVRQCEHQQELVGRAGVAGSLSEGPEPWELWCDGQQGVLHVWGTQSSFVPVPGNLECNPIWGSSKQLVVFLSEEQQDENMGFILLVNWSVSPLFGLSSEIATTSAALRERPILKGICSILS